MSAVTPVLGLTARAGLEMRKRKIGWRARVYGHVYGIFYGVFYAVFLRGVLGTPVRLLTLPVFGQTEGIPKASVLGNYHDQVDRLTSMTLPKVHTVTHGRKRVCSGCACAPVPSQKKEKTRKMPSSSRLTSANELGSANTVRCGLGGDFRWIL